METNTITVALDFRDLKTEQDFRRIISAIPGYLIRPAGEIAPCDLMILQIPENNLSEAFSRIDTILELHSAKYIFLTTSELNSEMLLKALRAGVKEVFQLPLVDSDVTNALISFKKTFLQQTAEMKEQVVKQGIILSLQGSKGGVGTTTLAVNIAYSLVEQYPDKSVVLIDMNNLYGDIPLFLDIKPTFNWIEVSRNVNRLDATYLMSILTQYSPRLYFLPAPQSLEGDDAITPKIIEKVLNLLKKVFDFIVIDNGQAIDSSSMQIFRQSHIVALVTVLSLPCLVNVKKLLDIFQQHGYMPQDRIRIIATRYNKKSEITLKDAEKSIKMQIFHTVANDYQVSMSAINQGKPVSVIDPKSELSKSIKELTTAFFSGIDKNGRNGTLKNFFSGSKVLNALGDR